MFNIKEAVKKQNPLTSGHRMCPGCGAPTVLKLALMGIEQPVVIIGATGCLEVSTTVYPYSAWNAPFVHVAFENAGANISGAVAAYEALKRRGKIDKEIKFVAFGGDGGTYDIGLQSLSGALERGADFTYICYNNQGYMNTGAQRSSATPQNASATTTPAGKVRPGKLQKAKDLTEIVAAHGVPYVAQTSLHDPLDVTKKVRRAVETKGAAFVNVLSPCTLFWKTPAASMAEICKLAVDSCFWPVYEIIEGKYSVSYIPKNKRPLEEFLRPQGRYAHLFKREDGAELIARAQRDIDESWEKLLIKAQEADETN